MATCPHCGAFLESHHRCRGMWRLRLRVWLTIALGGVCGAAILTLVSFAVTGDSSRIAPAVGALLGCVVTLAYLRGDA